MWSCDQKTPGSDGSHQVSNTTMSWGVFMCPVIKHASEAADRPETSETSGLDRQPWCQFRGASPSSSSSSLYSVLIITRFGFILDDREGATIWVVTPLVYPKWSHQPNQGPMWAFGGYGPCSKGASAVHVLAPPPFQTSSHCDLGMTSSVGLALLLSPDPLHFCFWVMETLSAPSDFISVDSIWCLSLSQ